MKINIINKSLHPLPEYKTDGAAGLDLTANLEAPITLKALERALIPTGLFLAIPQGFEGQIRPRSGWALKHGITCLNSPGTIDSDYRGEVKVILANLSNETFTINDGDRIAQLVISKHETVKFNLVQELENTTRGEGGFGSTGKK